MSVKENNRLLGTISSKCAKILAFWIGFTGDALSGNKWGGACSHETVSVECGPQISGWKGIKQYVADYFSGKKHKFLRNVKQEKQNTK